MRPVNDACIALLILLSHTCLVAIAFLLVALFPLWGVLAHDFHMQLDNHFGDLTVRETLNFSAKCRWVTSKRSGMFAEFDTSVCATSLCAHACLSCNTEMLRWIEEREQELGITPDPTMEAFMTPTDIKDKSEDIRTMVRV